MGFLDYKDTVQRTSFGLYPESVKETRRRIEPEIDADQELIDAGRAYIKETNHPLRMVTPTREQLIKFGKERLGSKEHGFLGEAAAGLGRGALRVAATPAYLADVAGEAVGWKGLERAGEWGAEKVEQYIKKSPRLQKSASISGDIRDNPQLWTNPNWYTSIVFEGAPTIASMFIPGMAAARAARAAGMGVKAVQAARMGGALTAGMGLEAGGAAEDIRQYEKRTGKQVPISTKLKTVTGTGVIAGSLEAIPVFNIFGSKVAKKLIGRIVTSMALEGGTEGAQEIVANAFAKVGYDADRDMVGGVIESVVGGVLLGGGMGAMQQTFQERINKTDPDKVADLLEQAEKETAVSPDEINQVKADIKSGLMAEGIKSGDITSEMMATTIERVAAQDPKLAEQIKGMFVTKETDLTENERRFKEDPLDAENNAAYLDKYIKKAKEPEIDKTLTPEKIEIPTFMNTPQALDFGKKATPEQTAELKRLWEESAEKSKGLKGQEQFDAGYESQLYREAYEVAANAQPSKPKPKVKVSPEKKEPIKFIGTRTRQGKEVPLFEATTGKNKGYQIDYNSELHEITNFDEYEEVVAAKPQPSKPAKAKPSEALKEEIKGEGIVGAAPKKPAKPIPSKLRTLRGAIKEIGGINFLNYSGELKDLSLYDKKAIANKVGTGIDQAVNELIADGWLDKNTTVESFLEELRTNPKAMLSRDRITADITTKKPHELSAEEKRLKEEMEREPEAPPEGEYVTLNAEDLPVGKKMTLLEGKTDTGWDIYEIQEKDEFSITLKDGKEITLSPLDKVQVLKKDIKKTEDIEIIDPDGTYVNREKVKTIEKDGLKATYYGTYRKDGAFKAWKTKTEIDKIKKAKGKAGLDLKQESYGKQAKVEPVDKMKQRGLGLEVEDKAQPGLFEKGKPTKKPAIELKTADELQKEDKIRPKKAGIGKGKFWEYRDEKGTYTVVPTKERAIEEANAVLFAKEPTTGVKEGIPTQPERTEKYVPITRKEADDLYDKGAADLVAHFAVRGLDTTGEEGYYMRLPVQKKLRGYDKKIYPKYSKEVIDAYLRYRKRHGGTESSVSIPRGTAEQRDGRLPAEVRSEKKFATKEAYEKDLIAYHNTTEGELLEALESGGLAMPSIAITRKDIPYEKYGPITLVGRKETIDPTGDRANRVFDSDIYSPRVPGKEWKLNKNQADEVYDRFEAVLDEVGAYKYSFEEAYKKGKEQFINYADRSNALKVAFLREQNIPIQIPKSPVGFHASLSENKDIQEYLKNLDYSIVSIDYKSKEHKQLSDAIKQSIDKEYKGKPEGKFISKTISESWFEEDGLLSFGFMSRFERDQKTLKEKSIEVDKYKLEDRLKKKFTKKLSDQYLDWINEIADPMYGEPFIMLGRKKVPYTLGNIVLAMKREGLKGKEKTLTFGAAKARAVAAKQIPSIKAMHGLKGRLVTEEKIQEAIENQEKVQDALTSELIKHYRHKDWRGDVEVWAALDNSMKSVGTFLSGKNRTTDRMQTILHRNGFDNVSKMLARKAINFSEMLMGTPTQYFEMKSQRAVGFDEFEGIVIPTDSSLKLRRALKEAGLKVKTYKKYDSEGRQKAISSFYKRKDVLFATKATKPQETITRKDLREIFTRMKNVVTGQDSKGNFFFRVAGRPRVTIFEVDEVSGYINTSSGQMPVGSYLGNKIELKTGGVGHTADIDTAYHEFFHYLSGAGILTGNDIKALDTAIGKATVTEEDRATYVGDRLANWPAEPNTRIKRILKKISDFMDTIWEFVTRTRTAESVIRDIESGRILKEKKEVLTGVNEFAQAVSFSLKKAAKAVTDSPNFVKWFGGSKVLNEKGEPLVVYHGTSGDFSIFEKEKIGTRYPQDIVEDAFWFSESSHGANLFAREFGGNVMPTYLSLKNPKIIDAAQKVSPDLYFKRDGKTVFDIRYIKRHTVIEAKADGYDGVVFKNAYDGTPASGDIYVAFEPTQIKSIYNTGAYGLTEPDIRYQQTAERFYSQVVKTVQDKMPAKMQASDVMNWLRKQPGIKAAELEWMDVEAMLEDKKTVERDELVGLLKENEVRVEEVARGISPDAVAGITSEDFGKLRKLLKEVDYLGFDYVGDAQNAIFEYEDWAKRWDVEDNKDLVKLGNKMRMAQKKHELAKTKFTKYQLEGEKENYREFLFKLPGIERFQSQHWPEDPNTFAHVRVNERTDADGEKILFIEEIQSDWELSIRKGERVPDMPFKKNWQEVVMKRIIRMAAEQGIDKISWTTGQQQADRYDLSKKVKSVYYNPSKKLLFAMDKDGGMPISEKVEPEGIEAYIGKEPAKRLLSSEVNKDGEHYIGGKDLKVGGQWTYALYDRMIPQYLKKFGKKYKAEVGTTEINNKQQPSFTITPALKRAALFEGMPLFQTKPTPEYAEMLKRYKAAGVRKPSFQETLEPVTEEDFIANRKDSRNIKLAAVTNIERVASEIVGGVDRFLGSISTRLGQVSPKLKAKMRRLDFDINTKHAKDVKTVQPLLEKAKKMSRDDFADWDYARKNSNIAKIGELINKYGMQDEYIAYRKILDNLRKEGLDVGLEIGEIEEYAPRILKDDRGFLKEIGKPEYRPLYSDKLKARAEEMGITVEAMPHDLKADIVSNIILGGWVGLGGIPATKHRVLRKIPADLNKFYMDSDAALMQHLHSMRKGIEARKFFGKIPKKVAEMRTRLYATQSKIRELNDQLKNELPKEESEELRKKRNKHIGLEKQYTAYLQAYALQRDYTENIGAYVIELIEKKEISAQHERVVNDILKARFHEVGTRGIIQEYKNLSYIDTMGSPISALTQIGDLAWAAYEGGLIRTLKYVYKSATKQSRITKEDVGVERIAQEFADSGTLGNAVSKIFKIVGLEKIDSIGKEALLNTALEKYQTRAKKEPLKLKREIRPIFENETDSVIDDLVNNEISDNVKLLTYSRLLDFQPVSLSEMPQGYLDAGNGRLFYMLKTFTIKVFDVFRNESYNKIRYGTKADKIQGFKNLVRLSVFFVLANAGADELKDFVLGRKTDFSDRMVDNALRLFGVSKYLTWRARTEGLPSALARQILPPFKFLDAAYKDIITAGDEKGLEMLGSVPIGGKLAYWHLGRGVSKREDLWNRRLRKYKAKLNKVSDGLEKSKNKIAFRQEHRKELLELRKVNRLQGRINLYRKRINKIKSRPESSARKKEIQKLEKIRTEMIKTYLAKK